MRTHCLNRSTPCVDAGLLQQVTSHSWLGPAKLASLNAELSTRYYALKRSFYSKAPPRAIDLGIYRCAKRFEELLMEHPDIHLIYTVSFPLIGTLCMEP